MSGFSFRGEDFDGTATHPETLHCKLQTYGKTAVKRGWRAGLPYDEPPIWVFCPLLTGKWRDERPKQWPPHDRQLITECGKCKHFGGITRTITRSSSDLDGKWSPTVVVPRREQKRTVAISRENLKKAMAEELKERREWLREEKKNWKK